MTAVTGARGGQKEYQDSIRLADDVLVQGLRDLLGAKLVAYIGAVKETRAGRQWADGERKPSADVMHRLRTAYRVAALLAERDSRAVVQAWFQGMNPQLDDVPPAPAPRRAAGRRRPAEAGRCTRVRGSRLIGGFCTTDRGRARR
jgi:hypothetical protein